MSMKVCPKTGIITRGFRHHISPPPSRTARTYDNRNIRSTQLDIETLIAMAHEIGKVIAKEIKSISQPPVVIQAPNQSWKTEEEFVDGVNPAFSNIKIDESVIDVGLGKTKKLKKGEGSATIAKEDIQSDKSFGDSKNKLKALKRGGS